MNKKILITVTFLAVCGSVFLLKDVKAEVTDTKAALETSQVESDSIQDSYYEAQDTQAFEFFKRSQVQKFLAMWVKEKTNIESPKWNYDSFAQFQVIDHDMTVSRPEDKLYYCTFSDGSERQGYVIIKYNEAESSMSNWGVLETTPYVFDLKANKEKISKSLMKTDIDLHTAKASRVSLLDKKKKRSDQVIRFTDGKGDNYICYLGDDSLEIKKW